MESETIRRKFTSLKSYILNISLGWVTNFFIYMPYFFFPKVIKFKNNTVHLFRKEINKPIINIILRHWY